MVLTPYALVDLATLKRALGIEADNVSEDDLLTELINVATARLEQDTQRLLHWRVRSQAFDGPGVPDLLLPLYPVTAVLAVAYQYQVLTSWIVGQLPRPDGVDVLVYADAGMLRRPGGWPIGDANVYVEWEGGYGSAALEAPPIPASLEEASVLLAADGYQTRKTGTWNTASLALSGQSLNLSPDILWRRYKSIINPFRSLQTA